MRLGCRRQLKHILKNTQRLQRDVTLPLHEYDLLRNCYLQEQLCPLGLFADFSSLSEALRLRKACSRHFSRLGRAALRTGRLCSVLAIASAVEVGMDLREISFAQF